MTTERRLIHPSILVLAAALAVLAGCNKANGPADQTAPSAPLAALPLTDANTPLQAAPDTEALPPAPPIRTAQLANPDQAYAYVDEANEMNQGFGDAPPDYAYDYSDSRPWAWRSDDGYERVVEPLNNGDRDYYYEPNSDEPFLVRDGDYSYGYRGGVLVVVYDREGRPMPYDRYGAFADRAARVYARARMLHDAQTRAPHHGVERAHWQQRRDAMTSERQAWYAGEQSDATWRAYHDQTAANDARWNQERYRRENEAVQVDIQLGDQRAAAHDRDQLRVAQAQVQAERGRGPAGAGSPFQRGPLPPAAPAPALPPAPTSGTQLAAQQAQARAEALTQQQAAAQARAQTFAQQQAAAHTQAEAAAAAKQAAVARAQAQALAKQQAAAQAGAQAAAARQAQQQALEQKRLAAQQAAAQAHAQAATQQQARAQAAQQQRLATQQAQAQSRAQQLALEQQRTAAQQARIQAQAQKVAQAQAAQQQRLAARQAQLQVQAQKQAATQQRLATQRAAVARKTDAAAPPAKKPLHKPGAPQTQ